MKYIRLLMCPDPGFPFGVPTLREWQSIIFPIFPKTHKIWFVGGSRGGSPGIPYLTLKRNYSAGQNIRDLQSRRAQKPVPFERIPIGTSIGMKFSKRCSETVDIKICTNFSAPAQFDETWAALSEPRTEICPVLCLKYILKLCNFATDVSVGNEQEKRNIGDSEKVKKRIQGQYLECTPKVFSSISLMDLILSKSILQIETKWPKKSLN